MGDKHKVQLNESVLINECRTIEHYLDQESKTEEALREMREILEYNEMDNASKVHMIKELVEWRLR